MTGAAASLTPAANKGVYFTGTNSIAFFDLTESGRALLSALTPAAQVAALGLGSMTGSVLPFAMNSAPAGWLKANGAAVSRSTYANLFSAIGTTYGAGNGSTTFNLPDLRGEFIRGFDDGRGVDAGRTIGSAQGDDNKAHTHTGSAASAGAHTHGIETYTASGVGVPAYTRSNGGSNNTTGQTNSAGAHTHTLTIDSGGGGAEARPRNIALLYCIKF